MKRNIIKLFLLLLLFSCNKNLDKYPLDRPSNETFYSTEAEIVAAVNACYNYIAWRGEWPDVPSSFKEEMFTDVLSNRNSASSYTPFKLGTLSANSALPAVLWSHFYAGVNRTNSLIENMYKAEGSAAPAVFKRVKSEARVIRAIDYMELIEKFGDVPLVTKFLTVEESLNVIRNKKADILQFIYKEIDESVADLPAKYTAAKDKGRVTKGTALAMKARIALYNNDWAVAKAAAKACMDLNVYKLYPNYRNLFTYIAQNNDEIILDFQFMPVLREHAWHFFNAPRNSNGQSQSFPTEDMVASFECTDGKIISQSPLYDPTNPFVNRDPRLSGAVMLPRVWDGTTIKTSGTVFNGFEFMSSKEVLKAAGNGAVLASSLSEREKTVTKIGTTTPVANQEVTNAFSSRTGYVNLKYMDSTFINIPSNEYQNIIMCRYPEVLLTYAEASIELGQVDQTVLDAVNMARARAYGNTNSSGATNLNATNYPKVTTMDPSELRTIVRRERKVELCFEGLRMEDLKRWNLLSKALSGRVVYGRSDNFTKLSPIDKPVIDADGLITFPYATQKYGLNNEQTKLRFYETYGSIPATFKLLPIPLGEMQLNANLTQNPGY